MANQTYLVKYLHAAAFIPVKSTWIKYIQKGYFQSWQGLTVQRVNNYIPNSVAKTRGQIDQVQKNMRSKKLLDKEDTEYATIINEG